MEITWTRSDGEIATTKVPAHVEVFAEVIGLDATAELCVSLGGAVIYLPCSSTRPNGLLRSVLQENQILALSRALSPGSIRIPLANQFLARYYRSQNNTFQSIARKIRIDERSVRRILNGPMHEN